MYSKEISLLLSQTPSPVCNNLSVSIDMDRDMLHYAVVSGHRVMIYNTSFDRVKCNHREVVCRNTSKEKVSSSVQQARLIAMKNRLILVVASECGVQMFDATKNDIIGFIPNIPIFCYNTIEIHEGLERSEKYIFKTFARGICGFQDQAIYVGVSIEIIVISVISGEEIKFSLSEALEGHKEPICDLQSDNDHLFSSDDSGTIIIWKMDVDKKMKPMIQIAGYGYPCTSLAVWNGLLLGGYGSGHLRVYNVAEGEQLAEVTAHAKWITAIDVAMLTGLLLSASEDSMIQIWQLSITSPQIKHVYAQCVPDIQLHGARFISPDGMAFRCVGYDCPEIMVYVQDDEFE